MREHVRCVAVCRASDQVKTLRVHRLTMVDDARGLVTGSPLELTVGSTLVLIVSNVLGLCVEDTCRMETLVE